MFDAVIFDWDGTLADTRAVIVNAFQKALRDINLSIDAEYIERRMGIGASETFREILRSSNVSFNEDLIKRLVERKSQVQIEHAAEVELFSGARSLLESLYGEVKLGLASMNNYAVINSMLKPMGLEKYFQAVLTVNDVSHSKPHPEIFLKTAERLGCLPNLCVVVEDSLFGVQAAKAGGMGCIGVTTGVYLQKELEAAEADLVVVSLNDRSILKFIFS